MAKLTWGRFVATVYNQYDPLSILHDTGTDRTLQATLHNYIDPANTGLYDLGTEGTFLEVTGPDGQSVNDVKQAAALEKTNYGPGRGDVWPGASGGGKGTELSAPENTWDEKNPPAGKSMSTANAQTNYTDYVKWKRSELEKLIAAYREAYPKQIAAYKTSAISGLEQPKRDMWGGIYANLDKRGLSGSASFLGGGKSELEKWYSGEEQKIEDTAQGMETGAQSAILAAIGKPDYAGVYNAWTTADQQNMEYLTSLIGKKTKPNTTIIGVGPVTNGVTTVY
jgi:hypothetical protein